jgi:pyrroline-5-carboxylate reductase
MESGTKIGFIGGGNMTEALIKGLLNSKEAKVDISVFDSTEERRHYLEQHYHIHCAESNPSLVKNCDIVFLSVKPQVSGTVLHEIADTVSDDRLLISVMAGISTRTIESYFTKPPRLIRAMPNTPALIGEGATALCAGSRAEKQDIATASTVLKAIGPVFEVGEVQIDTVTGLSGSGPAYVFSFIEALADGGVLGGIPRDIALELAVQTVLGAAMLVKKTGEHPALLREKVCSPGGTTIAGVKALEANSFRNTVIEAVSAATRRSRELGGSKKAGSS